MKFRKATVKDVGSLYELILKSTGGRTEFTIDELNDDLFGRPKVQDENCLSKNQGMEIDFGTISNNVEPVVQAIVVEHGERLIGYVTYHHYFSPWLGHKLIINDFFVTDEFDRKEIFQKLEQEVVHFARREGSDQIMYNVANFDKGLVDDERTIWVKERSTDWCLIRIGFNWSEDMIN